MSTTQFQTLTLTIQTTPLTLSTYHRPGRKPAILFLHGFGSCKEDLYDLFHLPALREHTIIAYDAPGCGHSSTAKPSTTTIPFLVETATAVLEHYNVTEYHLIGHSMGGLTALCLAHENPENVLSFVKIKGNLAPEDCFLSRQILTHPGSSAEEFLDDFVIRTRESPSFSNALYAAGLKSKVRADVVAPIFTSMVELSDATFEDGTTLLDWFLGLPCPRMFMFGELNKGLSYLGRLEGVKGVQKCEIVGSGHFPMYSNPVEMCRRIVGFYEGLE